MTDPKEEGALPKIDFATFVLSLSHSALMHLYVASNAGTKRSSGATFDGISPSS